MKTKICQTTIRVLRQQKHSCGVNLLLTTYDVVVEKAAFDGAPSRLSVFLAADSIRSLRDLCNKLLARPRIAQHLS